MRSFKLAILVVLLNAYACDDEVLVWTRLRATLNDNEKLVTALANGSLPTDYGSLIIIATHIKEHAPHSTGSTCCFKKPVEPDETLQALIAFHSSHIAPMQKKRNSLSSDQLDSLEIIEKNIKKMPKNIRRSYSELPNPDQ